MPLVSVKISLGALGYRLRQILLVSDGRNIALLKSAAMLRSCLRAGAQPGRHPQNAALAGSVAFSGDSMAGLLDSVF